jgi:hypothetical protein
MLKEARLLDFADGYALSMLARALIVASVLLAIFLNTVGAVTAAPRVLSVMTWLNEQVRQSELVVLGQNQRETYPDPQTGIMKVGLLVGQVYSGPRVTPRIEVRVKSGWHAGRFLPPAPLGREQWVLLFCRKEKGHWVAPPLGRIVESPAQGLIFYPPPDVILEDASPGLSWSYILDSLSQLVATRRQIINAYTPRLRQAKTKEQRDRILMAIEFEVRDHLGLPVP